MTSSSCSRRLELAAHLVRVAGSSAVFGLGVHLDATPLAVAGSAGIVFGVFGLGHDLAHHVLATPRRLGSDLLSLSHLSMLGSGHGVAATHRIHHRRPLADDDAEGRAARRSLAGAILHAPLDAWRARVAGFTLASRADRPRVLAENAASFLLASILASGVVPGGRIHLAVCLVAQLTIGIWASWVPHHAPGWLLALARPGARAPSLVARSLVHHELHHARPDVPSAWLAGIAATAIALSGCATADAGPLGSAVGGTVAGDVAEIHRNIHEGTPATVCSAV